MAQLRYVVGALRVEFIDDNGNQFYAGISEYAPRAEGRTIQSAKRNYQTRAGRYDEGFCWDRKEERYV